MTLSKKKKIKKKLNQNYRHYYSTKTSRLKFNLLSYKQISMLSGLNTEMFLFYYYYSCVSRRTIILFPANSVMSNQKEWMCLLTIYSLPIQCRMTKSIALLPILEPVNHSKKSAHLMLKALSTHPLTRDSRR